MTTLIIKQKKFLVKLQNANADVMTTSLHTEHMISNVSASTHSKNTIASQSNAQKRNANNAKVLQVPGYVHVVLNMENTKLLYKLMSNGKRKEKQQMIWAECITNLIILQKKEVCINQSKSILSREPKSDGQIVALIIHILLKEVLQQ